MAELRLVGLSEDGKRLVLADPDGPTHTIEIDERLRADVGRHASRLGQLTMALESRISPREIQERIRAGESAEHLAQTAGVPLERVLRFVGPVLREREHVAQQAQQARITGHAGATGPSPLLVDVVERAATRRGFEPDDVGWDSARGEDHTWVVTTTWPDGTQATWALDVLHRHATPADPLARQLSGIVAAAADEHDGDDGPGVDAVGGANGHDTIDLTTDAGATIRPFVPRALGADGPTENDAAASGAHDEQAALDVAGDQQGEEGVPVDQAEPADPPAATPRAPGTTTGRSSRRARVPKWDDIVFGMKPKD